MAEPFIGQLIIAGFDFAPRNYAKCDGQLLSINQHQALFSLVGTQFGGDGRTSFGLPDLRGRVPMHAGNQRRGERGGQEAVVLTSAHMPAHTHAERHREQRIITVADRQCAGELPTLCRPRQPRAHAHHQHRQHRRLADA